jgi:HAD superfamily hydrolase (TIGR01509 family)
MMHPRTGVETLRVIRAYRQAQEDLRGCTIQERSLAAAQLALAARKANVNVGTAASIVNEWMFKKPLPFLARSIRPGLVQVLAKARLKGIKLGVLSDYPASEKLLAMNLAHFFDVIVTSGDEEVRALKPDPRGLDLAVRRLGIEKSAALYIGDRIEIDAEAAANAGIGCVILSESRPSRSGRYTCVCGFKQLESLVSGL